MKLTLKTPATIDKRSTQFMIADEVTGFEIAGPYKDRHDLASNAMAGATAAAAFLSTRTGPHGAFSYKLPEKLDKRTDRQNLVYVDGDNVLTVIERVRERHGIHEVVLDAANKVAQYLNDPSAFAPKPAEVAPAADAGAPATVEQATEAPAGDATSGDTVIVAETPAETPAELPAKLTELPKVQFTKKVVIQAAFDAYNAAIDAGSPMTWDEALSAARASTVQA